MIHIMVFDLKWFANPSESFVDSVGHKLHQLSSLHLYPFWDERAIRSDRGKLSSDESISGAFVSFPVVYHLRVKCNFIAEITANAYS